MHPRLSFFWTHDNATGYGRMGTSLAKEFAKQGVEVIDGQHETDTNPASHVLWAGHSHNATEWFEGQHRSLLTMWETTRMPELIREGLDNFEQVFVPSEHNLELFGQYHHNVAYVPLGVDPEVWKFRKRWPPRQTFRFLADGRGERKGTDISIAAFKAAFGGQRFDGPEPTLLLKGSRHTGTSLNGIQVVASRLSPEAEVALYGSAHVYLAPTRGEGWGLPPMQAIAQGIPTILTDAHGQAAFAHLGWRLHAGYSKSTYDLYGQSGDWWEPDFDECVEYMRWMYENYDKAEQMAELFSEEALSQYTWENSASDLLGHLELDNESPTGPWVAAEFRRYPVVLRIGHNCEIGGVTHIWEPGKLYYERAETKRTLYESAYLDPSCLEMDDNGLTPEQCERISAVTGSRGYCPLCLQELNSKPLSDFSEAKTSRV